jgi:hypothetical protein
LLIGPLETQRQRNRQLAGVDQLDQDVPLGLVQDGEVPGFTDSHIEADIRVPTTQARYAV